MNTREARSANFEPASAGGRQARRFVTSILQEWDLDGLSDAGALCVTELVTNAIHHTHDRFTVSVQPAGPGVRIGVLDVCPDRLPVPVPVTGSAADLTMSGTTGRGLQIVAALATRWGYSTTSTSKVVWVELVADHRSGSGQPVVSLGHHRSPGKDEVRLRFLGLPVRPAVASGVQVDALVREIELRRDGRALLADGETDRFFDLLDRSTPARLAGRHAALRAASEGLIRFDLDLLATDDSLQCTGALRSLLEEISDQPDVLAGAADDDVKAFRSWLERETTSQRAGHSPSVCPLDAPLSPGTRTGRRPVRSRMIKARNPRRARRPHSSR